MQAMMNQAVGDAVPRGWVETRLCWGPIFKLLIEDHQFWQEHVHAPAMSWLAYGRHGQPKTPSEVMAAASFVGGEAALKAGTEPVGTSRASADPSSPSRKQQANRDKREARKKRLKNDREELQRLRGDGPGKAKGRGKGKTEGKVTEHGDGDASGSRGSNLDTPGCRGSDDLQGHGDLRGDEHGDQGGDDRGRAGERNKRKRDEDEDEFTMTEEQYLANRKFLFIHHYAGKKGCVG